MEYDMGPVLMGRRYKRAFRCTLVLDWSLLEILDRLYTIG